jgi:hypothetical protein
VTASPTPRAARKKAGPLLDAPVLSRRGSRLYVAARPLRGGILEVTARKGSSRLGGCLVRASAGRSITCQIRLAPDVAVKGVRVSVSLRVGGAVVARRTASYARVLATYRGTALQCWLGAKPPRAT